MTTDTKASDERDFSGLAPGKLLIGRTIETSFNLFDIPYGGFLGVLVGACVKRLKKGVTSNEQLVERSSDMNARIRVVTEKLNAVLNEATGLDNSEKGLLLFTTLGGMYGSLALSDESTDKLEKGETLTPDDVASFKEQLKSLNTLFSLQELVRMVESGSMGKPGVETVEIVMPPDGGKTTVV